jgi:hypothetical protein
MGCDVGQKIAGRTQGGSDEVALQQLRTIVMYVAQGGQGRKCGE